MIISRNGREAKTMPCTCLGDKLVINADTFYYSQEHKSITFGQGTTMFNEAHLSDPGVAAAFEKAKEDRSGALLVPTEEEKRITDQLREDSIAAMKGVDQEPGNRH